MLDEANTGSDNWKELDGILAWSPDSQWIAYRKKYDDGGSTRYNALFIVNIATKATYQLTTGYDDYNPFWSPAGNQILFHDRQDSSYSSRDDDIKLGATNNQGDILILNLIGDYGSSVPSLPWHMFLPAIQSNNK